MKKISNGFGVLFLVLGVIWVSGNIINGDAVPTRIWVPVGAELRDASKITTGTFKIRENEDEFVRKAEGNKVIVQYGHGNPWGAPSVVYWRPEGAVFYTTEAYPQPLAPLSLWANLISGGGNAGRITSPDNAHFYWQPNPWTGWIISALVCAIIGLITMPGKK